MSIFQRFKRPVLNPPLRSLTQPGAGGGGPAIYPVDDVGGVSPLSAYGAVKLASAYSGPALRVVRASDSAQQDIAFSGSELDAATLDSFLSGTTGKVVTWYDQSGNANDATQPTDANRPGIGVRTVAGRRCASFTRATAARSLAMPAGVSASRRAATALIVCSQYNARQASCLVQIGTGATNQWSFYQRGNVAGPHALNGTPMFQTTIRNTQGWGVYTGRLRVAGTDLSENATSQTGAANTDLTMAGGYVGFSNEAANVGGYLDMVACILYGRALSDAELAAGKAALHGLFEFPAAETARVVWDGDSISAGSSNEFFDAPGRLAQALLPAGIRHFNTSVGGQTMSTRITNYPAYITQIVSAAPGTIVVQNVGTNDLNAGTTAATLEGLASDYAALVRADSGLCILCTILPNNLLSAGEEIQRLAYNQLLRDNWATYADGLIDYTLEPTVGSPGSEDNTTYYPDGTHPNYAACVLLAPYAAAGVEALL